MSAEANTEEPPLPPVLAGGMPLIFDWRRSRWRKTRLMVALAVAAAGHILVFYLFQVVSASSPRQAPPVREAMILPGNDESARRVLESVEDRLPELTMISPPADREGETLAAMVKGYIPTWQDHRPTLKAMPGQGGSGPLPALMASPAVLLPPLPAAENPDGSTNPALASATPGTAPGPASPAGVAMPESSSLPSPATTAAVPRALPALQFQSGLVDRPLKTGPVWPAAVTAEEWPEEGGSSFLLSVDPTGIVTSCLPLGTTSGLDEKVLRGVLMKLRFAESNTSDSPQWGWVDVLW